MNADDDDDAMERLAPFRVLLDTNAFLWATQEPEKLNETAREAIESPDTEVYVSAAVAWEISIKHNKGNLPLPLAAIIYVPTRMKALGFHELPITQEHALATASLPAIHADPFDRIMIAQAQVESLTLVTRDAHIITYPVKILLA